MKTIKTPFGYIEVIDFTNRISISAYDRQNKFMWRKVLNILNGEEVGQ